MAKSDDKNIQPGDLTEALALLTRLPVVSEASRGVNAAWAWPLVGALVGLIAGLIATLLQGLGLPIGLAAAAALVVQIITTGALHEDGLADCADGFWGGHTRERRLEIMKDSSIGTYGTLALVLSILMRWILLNEMFAAGYIFSPLIAVAAASRVPMVGLMYFFKPARSIGMSANTGRPQADTLVLAIAMALLIGFVVLGFATIPLAMAVAALTWVTGNIARSKIDGQTGDVLGASQQIAEIGGLAVLVGLLA